MLGYLTTPLPCQMNSANRYRTERKNKESPSDKSKLDISWSKQWMKTLNPKVRHVTHFKERWQYFTFTWTTMAHGTTLREVHHFTFDCTEEFKCFLLLHVMNNERGERTASYRWTGWVWQTTVQIPRLQEIYLPFQRNLRNMPRKKKGKPKDDAVSVGTWTWKH